jgi:hypothetical protein
MIRNARFVPRFHLILSEEDVQELTQRLQIDKSSFIHRSYGYYRRYTLEQMQHLPINQTTLNSKQLAVMLEFFLQMDGMLVVFS